MHPLPDTGTDTWTHACTWAGRRLPARSHTCFPRCALPHRAQPLTLKLTHVDMHTHTGYACLCAHVHCTCEALCTHVCTAPDVLSHVHAHTCAYTHPRCAYPHMCTSVHASHSARYALIHTCSHMYAFPPPDVHDHTRSQHQMCTHTRTPLRSPRCTCVHTHALTRAHACRA